MLLHMHGFKTDCHCLYRAPVQFNNAAGSPAPETATEAVYELTQSIDSYRTLEGTPDVDLSTVGSTQVGSLVAEVIDSAEDYVQLLRRTFDFAAISALLKRPDFSMVYDAMAGAAGPYARRVSLPLQGCC
jgi:phosphoglucomutase